jgi:hypothetical protein
MSGIIQECSQSPSLTVIGIACIAVTVGWCVLLAKVLL